MTRIQCMAVVAACMVASVLVKANQCSSGGECPSDDEPQNTVSLLQSKILMNVLPHKLSAGGKEAAAQKQATETRVAEQSSFIQMVENDNPKLAGALIESDSTLNTAHKKQVAEKAAHEEEVAEKAPTTTHIVFPHIKKAYAIVYVIGGLLVAIIFNQVREKNFAPVLVPDNAPDSSTEGFKFPLFGCLSDLKLCVLGCFCPCLAWANTMDQHFGTYWLAFFAFFGLTVLEFYTWGIPFLFIVAMGVYYRQKHRERHGTVSSCSTLTTDILSWLICQPCAIIQEAREDVKDEKQSITNAQ